MRPRWDLELTVICLGVIAVALTVWTWGHQMWGLW